MSYVYLMRREGLYKIGRSAIPSLRSEELRYQTGTPHELIWQLRCYNSIITERAMHIRYARYNVTHEIFDLPDDVLQSIMAQTETELCAGYNPREYCRPNSRKYRLLKLRADQEVAAHSQEPTP